jgi:predicted RecB family nuclease
MRNAVVPITNDLFRDFLNCKYKAFLKINGKCGQKSDYENLQVALLRDYRHQAEQRLLHSLHPDAPVEHNPVSLSEAIRPGPAAITAANAIADGMSCHFDALVCVSNSSSRAEYLPVLYSYANQTSKDDRLLLAFCGLALSRLQGGKVPIGKIICGSEYATIKVQLAKLLGPAKKALRRLVDLQASTPPLWIGELSATSSGRWPRTSRTPMLRLLRN